MVRRAVRAADLDMPTEVALGMGMHSGEVRRLQEAVDRLERKGVARIVVVPLLVSSHSEVFRQFEYLFGLRAEAQWRQAGEPLDLEVPLLLGRALDDDPLVAEILLERAFALSRSPERETVILVAHGPNGEADNQRWLEALQRLASHLTREGTFRQVLSATLRDDAPKPIQEGAARQLREMVRTSSEQGRTLVVPVLIARGGIEEKIPKLLAGLTYVYTGQTLLPHPKLEAWIGQEALRLAHRETSHETKDDGDPSSPVVE